MTSWPGASTAVLPMVRTKIIAQTYRMKVISIDTQQIAEVANARPKAS
eukprot:CAMPEP_0172828638 /NCGR_PEP_ID=MMETSP1075-20121228/20979_1 /TAXON_ID=2916 /ORGANISM="Ceratium fusus, Strain PA161109" /LENGTH=47 /DNA_ID= /DNA_START= /DNA_END= /DNA_ORIENTATION=